MLFIVDLGEFWSYESPPENWYSVEFEVNSNGNIINGVNHCYAFGKINNETFFYDNDFPCSTFSSPYSNPIYNISNDVLPYLGGQWGQAFLDRQGTGTVRIRYFEWLKGVTMPRWLEEVTMPRFPKGVPIDYFYGKFNNKLLKFHKFLG